MCISANALAGTPFTLYDTFCSDKACLARLQYGHPGVVNTTTLLAMVLAVSPGACCCAAAATFTAASLDLGIASWLARKLLQCELLCVASLWRSALDSMAIGSMCGTMCLT